MRMIDGRKQWRIREQPAADDLARFPEQSRVLTTLLFQRNLRTQEAVDAFLEPEYSHDLHSPFAFRMMEMAVDRILDAIRNRERITIYGDYDADGVCGAAVLYCTLREFGVQPDVYIPYRMTEGYGMSTKALTEIANAGSTLVITNDLGITNTTEIAFAKEKGIDVIVSDHHHEPPVLPDAFAVLNPMLTNETYPYRSLCGTGVSFKLATGLLLRSSYAAEFRKTPLPEGWEKWLLDLVAIGTVADVMPLIGENRTLVSFGLSVLRKTQRLGLRALEKAMRGTLSGATTQTIAFQIAPRLNAAGRLKHASTAFELLVTQDSAQAQKHAHDLEMTNRERQRLTDAIALAAKEQIGQPARDQKIVFAQGEGWQRGVVGIVAGKLVDTYGLPAIVSGIDGEVHGSGRSVPSFNIIEAVIKAAAPLSKYGGHAQACGFTAPNLTAYEQFKTVLTTEANAQLAGKDLRAELPIDMELTLPDLTWEFIDDLARLEPYGEGNLRPRFLIRGAAVTDFRTVGSDGKHLRLVVSQHGVHRKAVAFRRGRDAELLTLHDELDLVAEVEKNEWNGNQEIQLHILDFTHHNAQR